MSDSLDGILAASAQAKFERHLGACALCRTFHAEIKESLLLLDELPAVEVDAAFDDAVWARIRAEQSPRDLWSTVRSRLAEGWHGSFLGTSVWKWSPVGVAAGILVMFAFSSEPPAAKNGAAEVAEVGSEAWSGSPSATLARNEIQRVLGELETTGESEEFVAGMPNAVEKYLQSARDLRLHADHELRRSNYSYPLRRFEDPSFVPVTQGVPGRGFAPDRPVTVEQKPGTISF